MKNLKRVLSLALSGIMLVGMMAMSASAVNAEDFTDSDEITHTEAVSISTALKIIDGKEDGSFDPNGFVTRGQMAKMITRAMFGGEDPVLGLPSTPSFSDIKGRWDETYIEYCSNNGIINGRGDGTFDPEGNVTGTEAAKMLLTALGYKADIYGLVGPDWAITTNSIANQTKVNLYGGLKGLDPTQPFTRDQVAQMVYNTLNANTREMNPTMEITGKGEITYQYRDSGSSLLYDKYGAVRVEGVVDNNEFTNNSDGMKGKTEIDITNAAEIEEELGLTATTLISKPKLAVSSGKDVAHRAVIVYVKPSNTNKKDLSKGVVISDVIYDVNTNTEFTTTEDKTFNSWIEDQGLKFDDADPASGVQTADFYTNYDRKTDPKATLSGTPVYGEVKTSDASISKDLKNTRGTEVTFIDNDSDGVVDVVLRNTYVFGKITKWDEKNEKVTVKVESTNTTEFKELAPNNDDMGDMVAYDGVAKDDYVMVTKVDNTFYLTKAEAIEGTLKAYENETKSTDGAINENYVNKTKSLTVDDSKHKTNQSTKAYTADELDKLDDIAKASVLEEAVTVYLDNFGYAVAGQTTAASDFLFVANAAYNDNGTSLRSGTLTAYVYMEDGTYGAYKVAKYTASGASRAEDSFSDSDVTAIKGKLFKYTLNSRDELILEGAEAATDASSATQNEVVTLASSSNTVEYDKDRSKLTVAGSTVKYVTMDTVIFFVSLKTDSSNKLIIDKVRIFDQKTAPSMDYGTTYTPAGTAIWGGDTNKFQAGVSYYTTAGSSRELDAVMFTSTQAVSSNWLYLIDYNDTIGDGRTYWAVVDGELKSITTNDKTVRPLPNAFAYTMDGDLYDLDDTTYTLGLVGEVTYVDSKSIVIENALDANGVEAGITSNTVIARLDGKDTDLEYSVSKGDVVGLVLNRSYGPDVDAEGIFIIKEFDETSAAIAYLDPGVTGAGSATTPYKVDVTKYDDSFLKGDGATTGDLEAVKSLFVTSEKSATAKWTKKDVITTPINFDDINTGSNTGDAPADADIKEGTDLYLVVLPKSEAVDSQKYKAYKVHIDGIPTAEPTSVKLDAHGTNGATITGGPITLTANGSNTAAVTDFVENSADCVKFDITAATGTTATATLKKGAATAADYTSGDSVDLGAAADATGTTYVLTVTVTQSGYKTTTWTYTVKITSAA